MGLVRPEVAFYTKLGLVIKRWREALGEQDWIPWMRLALVFPQSAMVLGSGRMGREGEVAIDD